MSCCQLVPAGHTERLGVAVVNMLRLGPSWDPGAVAGSGLQG
jgi:hypothetical protein